MKVITSVSGMQRLALRLLQQQRRRVVVPTMGGLHEGHLALVRRAQQLAGKKGVVIVSIFVNPIQFNVTNDFRHYPRTLQDDLKKLRRAGVTIAFCPGEKEMYPAAAQTAVETGELSKYLCGAARPGHFRGVATVVAKLFHILQPEIALFGEKDFQQLAVIRQMVADLNFPIKIVGHPTVREPGGLAMSSRNRRLSPAGRVRARCLSEALRECRRLARSGVRETASLKKKARHLIGRNGRVDYIEVVDEKNLHPVKRLEGRCRMALAVFVEGVRLIDNCPLASPLNLC